MSPVLERSYNGAPSEELNMTQYNGSRRSCASPLSPARTAHRSEREQLSSLNDRLADYIDRVRELESDRRRLEQCASSVRSTGDRDSQRVRNAFELELGDARRMQAEIEAEKAQASEESQLAREKAEELRKKIKQMEDRVDKNNAVSIEQENLAQDLTLKLNSTTRRKRAFEQECEFLAAEKAKIQSKLVDVKKTLHDEQEQSGRTEQELKAAADEASMKRKHFEETLNEKRQHEVSVETTLDQIEQHLDKEYCNKLQNSLYEMRQELENAINQNRQQITKLYESKMWEVQADLNSFRDEETVLRKELNQLSQERRFLDSSAKELSEKLKQTEDECERLTAAIESCHAHYGSKLSHRDDIIKRLRDDIQRMMANYQNLEDTKIQLTKEIDTYHKLLDKEEKRIHVLLANANGASNAAGRLYKKAKRTKEAEHVISVKRGGRDDVVISDLDPTRAFIAIENHSKQDLPVGNWILKCTTGASEISYKFHNQIVLKAGSTISIYNCDSQSHHEPPAVLVMKKQNWLILNNTRIVLMDNSDQEVCWCEIHLNEDSNRSNITVLKENDKKGRYCCLM